MSDTNRIAFGSCNNQNLTNPLWDNLIQRNPDVFVWAGDAIYADLDMGFDFSKFPPHHNYASATPESLQRLYSKQKSDPSYQSFLTRTNATIFGTIDDHDYGMNNGDKNFEFKKESAMAFLDFIGEDPFGLMYKRAKKGLGLYGVKVFDFSKDNGKYLLSDEEAGLDVDLFQDRDANSDGSFTYPTISHHEQKRVAIFVLDVRTNKTPWDAAPLPNFSGDFLGERQWKWFETTIQRSNALVNIVVTGLQVLSFRNTNKEIELWSHFPQSRQRLYDALLQDNVSAPILVSGDVHMAQLLRKDCKRKIPRDLTNINNERTRPLVEMTTSGMTHSWGTCFGCQSLLHKTWKYYPCHFISQSFMTMAHALFPMPDLMNSYNKNKKGKIDVYEHGGAENARKGKQYSLLQNFGELEFNWNEKIVKMRVFGKDINAPPLLSASFGFDQLSGIEPIPGKRFYNVSSTKYGKNVMDGELVKDGEFICSNYQANPSFTKLLFANACIAAYFVIMFFGPPFAILFITLKKIWKRKKIKQE